MKSIFYYFFLEKHLYSITYFVDVSFMFMYYRKKKKKKRREGLGPGVNGILTKKLIRIYHLLFDNMMILNN